MKKFVAALPAPIRFALFMTIFMVGALFLISVVAAAVMISSEPQYSLGAATAAWCVAIPTMFFGFALLYAALDITTHVE